MLHFRVIASMNNPEAVRAWRQAGVYFDWAHYWRNRCANEAAFAFRALDRLFTARYEQDMAEGRAPKNAAWALFAFGLVAIEAMRVGLLSLR